MDVQKAQKQNVNGLQEKVLEAIYYDDREGLSNKELCEKLGEKTGNISYATGELKEKDLVKDTEIFEDDKTNFKVKSSVELEKDMKYHEMMNTSAYIKITEGVILFFYAFWLYNFVIEFLNVSIAMLLGMLTVYSPSMAYTIFRLIKDEANYEISVYKQSTEDS